MNLKDLEVFKKLENAIADVVEDSHIDVDNKEAFENEFYKKAQNDKDLELFKVFLKKFYEIYENKKIDIMNFPKYFVQNELVFLK